MEQQQALPLEGIAPETPVGSEPSPAPTPQPVTIVEPEQKTWDDELGDIYDKINAPKEEAAPEKVEPAPQQAQKVSDQPETKASEPEQSSPAIAVPQSWSADLRAKWSALPPDVQQYVAEREKAAHARISQQGNELASFAPVREVFDWIRTQGVPNGREAEVIANWARAQAALDSNPVESLKWLAKSYNVDLAQLSGQQAKGPPGQDGSQAIDELFRDPRVDRITPEIGDLKNQISLLQRQLMARSNAEQQNEQSIAENVIDQFSADKADWDEVADDVVSEIHVIKDRMRQGIEPKMSYDKLLEKAYDRARYANPAIRQRILEESIAKERQALEAERTRASQEAAKKAEQARKVQSMNVRSGATASTPKFDGRWDDNAQLSAIYDRITSGR